MTKSNGVQRGGLDIKNGKWVVRYREPVIENGVERIVQRPHILGSLADYPPKRHKAGDRCDLCRKSKESHGAESDHKYRPNADRAARLGAPNAILKRRDEFMLSLRNRPVDQSNPRLHEFISDVYLPWAKANKFPSTYKGYADLYHSHFEQRVRGVWLRDVQPFHVQRWLDDIAARDKTADGLNLTKETLKHIKSFLSGVFKRAIQLGLISLNPVANTSVPPGRRSEETEFYTLNEIKRMIAVLPQPASVAVALAGYGGLSHSEIRGLLWENYDGKTIRVTQKVTGSHIGPPKTAARGNDIAVIPALKKLIEDWGQSRGKPTTGLMFPSEVGTPLLLNNLLNRAIYPIVNRCNVCREPKDKHNAETGHGYVRDETMPRWRGWHAFRRGLATNLHEAGVPDVTIQRILRHSDVSTTRRHYMKQLPKQAVDAMALIQSRLLEPEPAENYAEAADAVAVQ
jgi:integrase